MTSNFRGSSICSPKSLYKKTSNEILAELKAVVKTGALNVPEARPVIPQSTATHLLWQACVKQLALTHIPSPPRRREKKELFELQWTQPYLRVWVFLFLRTSFFTVQNVGPMVQRHGNFKKETESLLNSNPKQRHKYVKARIDKTQQM